MTRMKSQLKANLRFLSLACCLLASIAHAQHMNSPDAPCHGPRSGAEMTTCFTSASKLADERLNKIYARVLGILSGDEQKDLQVAQRLWLKFRDANCSAERNLYGSGSAAPTVYAACMKADARHRTTDLTTMYGWRFEKLGRTID